MHFFMNVEKNNKIFGRRKKLIVSAASFFLLHPLHYEIVNYPFKLDGLAPLVADPCRADGTPTLGNIDTFALHHFMYVYKC